MPHLPEPPSITFRRNVRLSSQPIEEPDDVDDLLAAWELVDAHHIVLFSSDYPHWDLDDPFAAFPERSRRSGSRASTASTPASCSPTACAGWKRDPPAETRPRTARKATVRRRGPGRLRRARHLAHRRRAAAHLRVWHPALRGGRGAPRIQPAFYLPFRGPHAEAATPPRVARPGRPADHGAGLARPPRHRLRRGGHADIPVISTWGDVDYPVALARAHNEWLIERWLSADERFRGSLVVATQDPQAAALPRSTAPGPTRRSCR